MTEEEKKRRQQRQAAAKARAQQQDAQAAEQAVANVEQEKPQATFAEHKAQEAKETKANVKTFLGNNRGGKMTTLDEIYQNAAPKEEHRAKVDAYNKQEQEKADKEWSTLVNQAHERAGSKIVDVAVDPMLEGTNYAENVKKMAEAGELDPSAQKGVKLASVEQSVDVAKVSSVSDLAYISASWEDDETTKAFIDMYAEYKGLNKEDLYYQVEVLSGGRAFDQPQSARGKATGIGVYNDYGESLDLSSASPEQFWRAIELTYDSEDQAALLDSYKKMYPEYNVKGLKVPGFLESAEMTKSQYNAKVDEMNALFTVGASEANSNAYMDRLNVLRKEYADNPRVLAQMERALLKSYERITNKKAPTNDEVQAAMEARAMEEKLATVVGEKAAEKAEKTYWQVFDAQPDAPSSYGAAASKVEVEEVEPVEEAAGYNYGGGGGGSASSYAATSNVSMPTVNPSEQAGAEASQVAAENAATVAEAEQPVSAGRAAQNPPAEVQGAPWNGGVQITSKPAEVQGAPWNGGVQTPSKPAEVQGAPWNGGTPQQSGSVQAQSEESSDQGGTQIPDELRMEYDPNMSDAEAFAAWRKGYALDERNMANIAPLINNPNSRGVFNTYGFFSDIQQADGSGKVIESAQHYGYDISDAIIVLGGGSLPEDMANLGNLELASVVNEIDERVKSGDIVVPSGKNQYAYALSVDENLAARVQWVRDLQKEADAAYAEQERLAKEAEDSMIEDIRNRVVSGKSVSTEELNMLSSRYSNEWVDLYDDDLYAEWHHRMGSGSSYYFNDDGAFWNGDSAAAAAGRNMRTAGRGYGDYKVALKQETENLLEGYTTAARNVGMSLEQYLSSAGIDDIGQIIDIAYNSMTARGNAYAKDTEAQATMEGVTESIGAWNALGLGARHGVEDTVADMSQTMYMALDAADYEAAVFDIRNDYTRKYGEEMAALMYRADLMAYADSGEMSEDAKADLLEHISRARSIFDVGYELEPGFIEGLARKGYETVQKDVEKLEAVAAKLPASERMIWNTASGASSSLTGMAISAAVGGVAAPLLGGTAAAAAGSAVAYGMPKFSEAYDDNFRNKKMTPGMAAFMAFGEAATTVALNTGSTGTDMDALFNSSAYPLYKKALQSGKLMPILSATAKTFASRGLEEAGEELVEGGIEFGFDVLSGPAKLIESGRPVTPSALFRSALDVVQETDPVELTKELALGAGMGFVMGGVFSLAGSAKAYNQAKRGTGIPKYASIDLATQMAEGKAAFTEENIGKVYSAMQKDMLDARFRKYIDSGHSAAQEQKATLAAVMMGTGEADRQAAVEYAQMAQEHSDKAEAAREASKNAQSRFWEVRAQLDGGDLSVEAELESLTMQWQKAETALAEAESAASKAITNAQEAMSNWLTQCRAQAGQIKSWMLEESANAIAKAREAAAIKLAEKYEAEEAAEVERKKNEAIREEIDGLSSFEMEFEQPDYSEFYDESETVATEPEKVDADKVLVESSLIAESKNMGMATEEELSDLKRNEDTMLSYMIDLMDYAKFLRDEMGNTDAYNKTVEQYNNIRKRFAEIFDVGKHVPEMKTMADPEEVAAEKERADKAKRNSEIEAAEAERDAKIAREVEMTESAVFGETETEMEAEAEVDVAGVMEQIADVQGRIDEAKSMGADADTIAALEAELEPLNAQKQKAVDAELRDFDMLYDMQIAASESDADDDYYQSLNDAYMSSMERLESMGVDVDEAIARQSGKAAVASSVQETAQTATDTAQAGAAAKAPKASKPRKIVPKKSKKETAAQKRHRELTQSIRNRRAATDAKLAEYKSASDFIAKTAIYVNESQENEILRETSSKNLTEVNGRYRARLTNRKTRTDAIPVENALPELVADSRNIVDTESTTPEMELAKVMNTVRKLRDDRRQEWEDARKLEEKKRAADQKRRESVKKEMEKKQPAPATETVAETAAAPANAGVDALAVSSSANTGVDALATAQSEPAHEATKKGKRLVTSALRAVQDLSDEIDVGFRIKGKNRFQSMNAQFGSNVLGYYKGGQRNAVVRSAEAGRLEVSGHEIGHAVQEQLGIPSTQAMIDGWKKNFSNTKGYTESQYDHEAFAEFFWRYLRGRDVAAAYCDEASVDAFEYALHKHKRLQKAVMKAQTRVSNYFNSSDTGAQIGANVIRMYEDNKKSTFDEKANEMIVQYVDDTAAMEPFQDVIRERLGQGHLPFDVNIRDRIRYNRRASDRAAQCIREKFVDNDGNVIGDPLVKVFEDIDGKDYDLFIEWWLARHSLDRNARATAQANREAGEGEEATQVFNQVFDESALSTEKLKQFIAETEKNHPEFLKTNEKFQKWRRLFFDTYLVNNGLLGDQARAMAILDELEKIYPFYAPTHRAGKNEKHTFKPHNVKGSTETIIDPFEYFVTMVNSIVNQVAENDNKKKFAQIFDAFNDYAPGEEGKGVGWFANELVPDSPAAEGDMAAFRKKLETILNSDSEDADIISHIGSLYADDEVKFGGKKASSMQNVIGVRDENGKTRYFEIYNPDMYQLLASVTGQYGSDDKGWEDSVAKLTRAMSMLTTGSNPVFAITNALRDFQTSVNYGSWATNYIEGAAKWAATFMDVVTKSEVSKEYDRLGGGGWSQFDTKTKTGSEELRGQAFKGYNSRNVGQFGKTAGRVLWKVATFEAINAAVEKTSRLVEYKYGKHDRSTADGRIEAFLASQDVTTDFKRHGNSRKAKQLKAFIPFINASMQGVYRTARQFTAQEGDRAKARLAKQITNTAMASLLANGLLMIYLDDDEKKEYTHLSQDLVTKHLFFPNWNREKGEPMLFRIPLDQNPISYAINAAVSNMVWKGETADDFLVGMAAVADVLLANIVPANSTIFDPLISMTSNKNWYGSNIVPTYLEKNSITNRYTEETPTLFVDLAKGINKISGSKVEVSPMMIQYLAEQYTGYIGQTVIPALPSEKNKNGIITGWFNALASTARKRVTSDPLMSNDRISAVYDGFKKMEQVSNEGRSKRNLDIPYLNPNLSDRDRELAVQEAYELSHKGGALYEAKKSLGELDDEIDEINAREDLTDRQKYLLTNDKRKEKLEIALDAQEVMQDYDARYRYKGMLMTMFEEMLNR